MTFEEMQKSFLDFEDVDANPRERLSVFWILLNHINGWTRIQFEMNKTRTVEPKVLSTFFGYADSYNFGKPIQYIVGSVEFYGNAHKVNSNVLIPRPETEELVDWIISDFKTKKEVRCLDIGTGSGCVVNSLALHLKGEFRGIDISDEALKVAALNSKTLNSKVVFEKVDVLSNKESNLGLNIIVSNPPYIPNKDRLWMSASVLEYEPELALFVPDENPLLFYKSIIEYSRRNLLKNGCLYFEIHEGYGRELKELVSGLDCDFKFKNDLQGKLRMLKIWNLV